MKKNLSKIIILIAIIFFIFPELLGCLLLGSISLLSNLFSFNKDFSYKLNESTIATMHYSYDGADGVGTAKINLTTNKGTFPIGKEETLGSKDIDSKELFQKVKSTDNYDIYYLNTNSVYDAKDSKVASIVKPLILFKDGTINFYENKLGEKNEFEKSLDKESNESFRDTRIFTMKNEINNFYNKDIFLSSWKILNYLDSEKQWVNDKIYNYYLCNDIPTNLKNINTDNTKDKETWNEYIECLNKILCLKGDRIYCNNEYEKDFYFKNFNKFSEISIDEAIKRYGSDNMKINGLTYDFGDLTLEFKKSLYYTGKTLSKAEIKRPIFYIKGQQVINKRYEDVKDVLLASATYRYKINENEPFPKEVLCGDWNIIINEDGIISKAVFVN